jgi:HlyD family secretion protein
MKRAILILVAVAIVTGAVLYVKRPDPEETPAVRVARANIVQTLTTNGRVEALDSYEVHARTAVQVRRLSVHEGDSVRQGQHLAEVDDTAAREALKRAEAQLEVVRADRALVERGGTAAEIAQLDAAIAKARLDKEAAEREVASLQRLVERGAVPRSDLQEQRRRQVTAESDLAALERKRSTFVAPEDRQRIEARIREAETAVAQARNALDDTEIVAPSDGTVYFLPIRPGGFYEAGTLVARVGKLDRVRVRLLVDEPELGPVQVGQPVRITWDALPSESWQGEVERLPSMVETVGTRTVGEVLCTIDTPMRRLLPNVTVNVQIRTGSADSTLTIPREAVVRQGEETLVFKVGTDGTAERRPVRLGLHDLGRVQVLEGLEENQVVLLPGERQITPGQKVKPRIAG